MSRSDIEKRAKRVRTKLKKHINVGVCRLTVFKSNKNIYAQIIDDSKAHTVVAASTLEPTLVKQLTSNVDQSLHKGVRVSSSNIAAAQAVGIAIAQKAVALGVTKVVFDKGGYMYHGCIKALADASRKHGLDF